MNHAFKQYIAANKAIADEKGVSWELPLQSDGSVGNNDGWNLTKLVNGLAPIRYLNNFAFDQNTFPVLNNHLIEIGRAEVPNGVLSVSWQELIKAATIDQLFVRRNTPVHIEGQVVRPLRVLATCVLAYSGAEPWAITAEDVRFACAVSAKVQFSGKLRELVVSQIKTLFDALHLCDRGPFSHLLVTEKNADQVKRGTQILGSLSNRKREELLPEMKALWELVRIVLTEKPKTFLDAIRFAQLRVLIICGFRIGEVCNIPCDWKREVECINVDVVSPERHGVIERSLMLRHFAEKQQGRNCNSVELVEAAQHIPIIFEEFLTTTLDRVQKLTAPLRERLRQQYETGRFIPELAKGELLSLADMYVRLTGNPIIREEDVEDIVDAYREDFSVAHLKLIAEAQEKSTERFSWPYYMYWDRIKKKGQIAPRFNNGSIIKPQDYKKIRYNQIYFRVGDIEDYIRNHLETKLPDTSPLPLSGGRIMRPDEMLFLMPKRSLNETRNDGVCDVTRYYAIGTVTSYDLIVHLKDKKCGIFARYGETEEDRKLTLNSHSLRHLQNTELFKKGIADTILSKRFNRRTVTQTHEYIHPTLEEHLRSVDLSPAAKLLPEKMRKLAALIQLGLASGPIVDQFKKIQKEQGDDVAFAFLAAEADGFHSTPYGFCVDNFTVEPCNKHLQCFDGCKNLVACMTDRQRTNLEKLRERTQKAIQEIEQRKGGIGRANQLLHAKRLVENMSKLLATTNGQKLFEDGRDLSERVGHNMGPQIDGIV